MSQNLSSAAVIIGALRVRTHYKSKNTFIEKQQTQSFELIEMFVRVCGPDLLPATVRKELTYDVVSCLDWLQSLNQIFIHVSYHILVASLTLMALF